MAFRDLVEGNCGNPSSLLGLASHYVNNRGFKEEGIQQLLGPPNLHQPVTKDELVKEFLEESACPQTFRMNNLLQEMRGIEQNISLPPMIIPENIIESSHSGKDWINQYTGSKEDIMDNNMHMMKIHPEADFEPEWFRNQKDYVEQFIDDTQNAATSSGSEQFHVPEDWKEGYIETEPEMVRMMKTHEILRRFERLHDEADKERLCNEASGESLNLMEEELGAAGTWTDEFLEDDILLKAHDYNNEWMKSDKADFSPFGVSSDSEVYEFQQSNPMKDLPNALEEGKRRLKMGDLPSAVLCFEAAVQQEDNNSEAWYLLGRAQAENEQDHFAIPALRHCLNLDPMNGAALMSLAVCYTNECQQWKACMTLREWLLKNEKYKHLVVEPSQKLQLPPGSLGILLDRAAGKEVQQLYIQAARLSPHEIDPDVQCGLGVLLTLMCEYEKAADCFQAALGVRPEDPGLWNRWGATLANGQRSAEAINAYRRALELSPGFIRARYNLGISCINLGAHAQAAEHFLIALNQQASGKDAEGKIVASEAKMSRTIWSSLRLVIAIMDKVHLLESVENRDLKKLNTEFGIVWNPQTEMHL
ncbi:PREDICTED: peroxisomal targeting signal 1 receptor [Dinoponera quadriceps]|uniref:Peroxisomal targeting signal 1 receptor n=1 Tax=Dinoponera quadriceps TaxID=609295 RepID=A0A6P3XSJ7_DINQU|nr:PREDICTED: peroxisomal targeting signal 1 receptor [Dinoponera quadriceps]